MFLASFSETGHLTYWLVKRGEMTVLKKEIPVNTRASSRGNTRGVALFGIIRRKELVGGQVKLTMVKFLRNRLIERRTKTCY